MDLIHKKQSLPQKLLLIFRFSIKLSGVICVRLLSSLNQDLRTLPKMSEDVLTISKLHNPKMIKNVYSTQVSSHISYGNCWQNIFEHQDVRITLGDRFLKLVLTTVEIF